ncbi:MAG: proprotein convertase P-domain-containing protein, partial [Planctomycetota bacterium]
MTTSRTPLALSLLLTIGLLSSSVSAQVDDRYRLYFEGTTAGTTSDVANLLDMTSGALGAPLSLRSWSYGVCHDASAVTLTGVAPGAALLTAQNGGPVDFRVLDTTPSPGDGYTVGVIVDAFSVFTLSPGVGLELEVATYEHVTTSPTTISYCATLGTPTVFIELSLANLTSAFPVTESVELSVGMPVLSHSTDTTIETGASFDCSDASGHFATSYWRSYTLCDFGIQSQINVASVTFGVESSVPGPGFTTLPVRVRIYQDPTPFTIGPPTGLSLLHAETFDVPALTLASFTANLFTPAGISCQSTLVVEVEALDGQADGHLFVLGANDNGQSGPSYFSAAACGVQIPTDLAALGAPDVHYRIDVNYTEGIDCGPCPPPTVDCHQPGLGGYTLRFEQADVFASAPVALISDALPPTTDSITVSGVATVGDMDVFVDIAHPFVGDLELVVSSPLGTSVTLQSANALALADVRTIYDDDGRAHGAPFAVSEPLTPERMQPSGPGSLSDFAGQPANGAWLLTITDGTLNSMVGALKEWALRFVVPLPIPDNELTGVTAPISVPATNVDEIQDVDVHVVIEHPAVEQLAFDVTSPAGTTVGLAVQGTFFGADLDVRFDDPGPTFCDGFGYEPVGPGTLADFDGQALAGDWQLLVADPLFGEAGALPRWELFVNPIPCDPPLAL